MENETAIGTKPQRRAGWMKRMWRRMRTPLAESRLAADLVVAVLGSYLRLVHRTNRLLRDDMAAADRIIDEKAPFIATCWHGQHFMMPFFSRRGHPGVVMVSRSRDAELNARLLERFGLQTVRASGGRSARQMHEKGALHGVRAMRRHLHEGRSVFMIADIPHGTPREAGKGIVSIARMSGVPILPVAYASSRRYVFEKAWDKAVLNLPFGRAAFCIGEPIEVPSDADEAALEAIRKRVEDELNRVFDEAYALVDARP
ncbi:lysophospholipid acyltransferase family protein [Oricola thermophila]|uniref:DUF374 domain-containing protein n=1 Tax=Oricola thermophila TaxID=2742145 RepID=A0A6N1VEB9_9HYPH|nr:lysophospholipid acyltransferase family protein [Oricola thermophila]QKV19204.1 DUF374 domain-containing protein [Oricola thermophila]